MPFTNASTSNHVALITGGSSGIGLAIAYELAAKGFSLLLASNQPDALLDCKKAIEKRYAVTCHIIDIDLSVPESAFELYNYIQQMQFEVDVLVNNAGILIFSDLTDTSPEKIYQLLQLHVVTPTLLCRLFGKNMKERKKGFILNVSSISAVMPYPAISVYGPSKSYIRYFSKALRHEFKSYGVKVTCLMPGPTATALYHPDKVNISLAMRLRLMHRPEYVAQQGIKALMKGHAECVPGLLNRLMVKIVPLLPPLAIQWLYDNTRMKEKLQAILN